MPREGVSDPVVDAAAGGRRLVERSADSILIVAPTADAHGAVRSLTESGEKR
jgi:hypothetical protein